MCFLAYASPSFLKDSYSLLLKARWPACQAVLFPPRRLVFCQLSWPAALLVGQPACPAVSWPSCHLAFRVSFCKRVSQEEDQCVALLFVKCLPKFLSFHLYYRVSEGLDNCLGPYIDQCLSTFLSLYLCYRLSQRVVQCHSLHFVQCRCVLISTFSRLLTSVWTSASVATSGSLSPEVSASASARLCAGVSTRTLNNTSPSVSQTLKVFTFASLSASVLSSLLQPPILIVSCQKNVSRPLLLLASCCRPEPSFDMASFVANCSSLVHY